MLRTSDRLLKWIRLKLVPPRQPRQILIMQEEEYQRDGWRNRLDFFPKCNKESGKRSLPNEYRENLVKSFLNIPLKGWSSGLKAPAETSTTLGWVEVIDTKLAVWLLLLARMSMTTGIPLTVVLKRANPSTPLGPESVVPSQLCFITTW